jgi:hypothetical protein
VQPWVTLINGKEKQRTGTWCGPGVRKSKKKHVPAAMGKECGQQASKTSRGPKDKSEK